MPVFTVAYDLKNKPESEYEDLIDEIESFHSHKIQLSYWLVSYPGTAKELRAKLSQHMHTDDKLWVARMHPNLTDADEYDWTKAFSGTKEWLKANPPT